MNKKNNGPRILYIDIETKPLEVWTWGTFKQNIALNQIKEDWELLSFAAKWADEDKVFYMDQRNAKSLKDNKGILQGIWNLLDQADIVCGQNSQAFDVKKINAKFIERDMPPPSSYRQIDTLRIAKKHFSFTSFKLEYMADKICKKYKKQKHSKFSGFDLWKQCMNGNVAAFKELEIYNKADVLATQELHEKFKKWDSSINFQVYYDSPEIRCGVCGGTEFKKNGYYYKNTGKFERLRCKNCGSEAKEKTNLLSKEKRASLRS